MELKDVGFEDGDLIYLTQVGIHWLFLASTVINLWAPKKMNFMTI
jgi:hypothetical protein